MKQRITGEKVEIDYNNTLAFFNGRGENKELKSKYNYVLFQDDNPELANIRDEKEKEKIADLLTWEKEQTVLDLGCGIGRWGEAILQKGLTYVGIDYCEKFIEIGKDNLKEYGSNAELFYGAMQSFIEVLQQNSQYQSFDKVFVNGVFVYLNETDVTQALKNIGTVCKDHCELYMKETLAIEERLTLNQIYSEDLTQNYTAIYRSIEEYEQMLNSILVKEFGFSIVKQEPLFEEGLRNRKETLDYYFILRK